MVRITYRDLAQLAGPLEISHELSALGEACTLAAAALTRPTVVPLEESREPMRVIGLGKLGSRQMHYGSDLDLLFLYDPPADGSPEARAAAQLEQDGRGERIAELLAAVTAEGVCYSVDLRLRAEGASGLLARTWESFAEYATAYMQPWERMALIRSRVLGGEDEKRWDALRADIVYRFRWDGDAIESIRHLKKRVETEKSKETRTQLDFKYGKGGVWDLEFLVQFLQLQYGECHSQVQAPSVDDAVPALQAAGALTQGEAGTLLQAHRFLRQVENRYHLLEEWHSRELSRESPKLLRLARSLGYPTRKAFLSEWDDHARSVRGLVEKYFY
jgi:glutamate-ammonia-ligase adenylyltransferase